MAISFSGATKAELCRCFPQRHCCDLAQCFGVLLFCNSFGIHGIRIITESREFAQLLPKLFKKAFDLTFDVLPEAVPAGKQIFQITEKENKLGRPGGRHQQVVRKQSPPDFFHQRNGHQQHGDNEERKLEPGGEQVVRIGDQQDQRGKRQRVQ